MDTLTRWLSGLHERLSALLDAFLDHLPWLAAAVALLLIGWLAAVVVRAAFLRGAVALTRVFTRVLGRRGGGSGRLPAGLLRVFAAAVYWIVVLYFVALAARTARLDTVAAALDRVVALVPSVLSAGVIILAGHVISLFVRDVVAAAVSPDGTSEARLAAFVAQGAVFLVAIVVGIGQLGIDLTFLMVLVSIVLAGSFVGLAVAFSLGARDLVSNLIGAQGLRRHYSAGQSVRIGEVDGEILEFTSTGVVVETAEGRVNVPGRAFHAHNTILKVPAHDD